MQNFMLLHHKDFTQKGFKIIVQRDRKDLLSLSEYKFRKKENEVSLLNTLDSPPGGRGAVVVPGTMGKL